VRLIIDASGLASEPDSGDEDPVARPPKLWLQAGLPEKDLFLCK
jgi:hypothetical protein